ncbi:MAG: tetratricopeptide repeat protein [Halanaerobiaceae bacterium]
MKKRVTIFIFLFILLSATGANNYQLLAEDIKDDHRYVEKEIKTLESYFYEFYEIKENGGKYQDFLNKIFNKADQLLKRYPDNIHFYEAVNIIYLRLGEYHNSSVDVFQKGKEYSQKLKKIESRESERGTFWEAAFMGKIGEEEGIISSIFKIKPMEEKLLKCINAEPDFAPAYDILARLYNQAPEWPLSIGDKNKALKYRKKSVKLDPYNFEYQWLLYKNYIELNEFEKAKNVLTDILNIPGDGQSKFYYGRDIRQETREKAREELKELAGE